MIWLQGCGIRWRSKSFLPFALIPLISFRLFPDVVSFRTPRFPFSVFLSLWFFSPNHSFPSASPDSNTKATTTMSLSRSVSRDDEANDGGDRADKTKWRNVLFKECNWAMVSFSPGVCKACEHISPASTCHSFYETFHFLSCSSRPIIVTFLPIPFLSNDIGRIQILTLLPFTFVSFIKR